MATKYAPSGARMVGGLAGGALLGFAFAGPSGAAIGGLTGLFIGALASEKYRVL